MQWARDNLPEQYISVKIRSGDFLRSYYPALGFGPLGGGLSGNPKIPSVVVGWWGGGQPLKSSLHIQPQGQALVPVTPPQSNSSPSDYTQ